MTAAKTLPLWNGPAPLSHGTEPHDIPTLAVYLPEKSARSTPAPAIVICPGGGYWELQMEAEGHHIAQWLQDRGMAAFVLKYRLARDGYHHPAQMLDAQRAVRLARRHAAEWNIDAIRLGVMGFSAGGHLASTVDTHFDAGNPGADDPIDRQSSRPDFAVLVYAVIFLDGPMAESGTTKNFLGTHPDPALLEKFSNQKQVTPQTPPTLLVTALDDLVVRPEHSRVMHAALRKAGVPSEIQDYPTGGHGFGYGRVPDQSPEGWLDHVAGWLRQHGFWPGPSKT